LGEMVAHCKVWGLSAMSCAEMAEPMDLSFGLRIQVGRKKHKLIVFARWRQCAQFQSYSPAGTNVPNSALPWAVQKQLNRSICHLGCGFRWAEGSTSSGGANVPRWEGTLAPPAEYDWTVHLRQRCGLTSNYFDHLL